MTNLPQSINLLYQKLIAANPSSIQSEESIYDSVVLSRLHELNIEDVNESSVNLFFTLRMIEGRNYYRFLFQIKTSNNSKVHNIESVLQLIRIVEEQFISIDKINTCQQENSYFVDIYKLIS